MHSVRAHRGAITTMLPALFIATCLIVSPDAAHAGLLDALTGQANTWTTARNHYNKQNYRAACPEYERGFGRNGTNAGYLFQMGTACNEAGKPELAIEVWDRYFGIKGEGAAPLYWLRRGMAEINVGKWQEATANLDKYLAKHAATHYFKHFTLQVHNRRRYAMESPGVRAKPASMKPAELLGNAVNSTNDDYQPQLSPDGHTLYFTSRRAGFPGSRVENGKWPEAIYSASRTDTGWTQGMRLPQPINSARNEGAAAFSADGQVLVYTACNRPGGRGNCDLYIAELQGSKWTTPINLGNVVNSSEWDSQPTLSSDGRTLIFASKRPSGNGEADLWETTRDRYGEWSRPVNLGSTINTPYNDASPFLSSDGKTLYFSSWGHPGSGGADVFMSVRENGKWSEPVNLGMPLNSDANDLYFSIGGDGSVGFFSSTSRGRHRWPGHLLHPDPRRHASQAHCHRQGRRDPHDGQPAHRHMDPRGGPEIRRSGGHRQEQQRDRQVPRRAARGPHLQRVGEPRGLLLSQPEVRGARQRALRRDRAQHRAVADQEGQQGRAEQHLL